MNERDIGIIDNILKYCRQIDEANDQFESDWECFKNNSVYRNAVAMCVLQIGELAKRLSEEYKLYTADEIPWHQIQGLRNIVAHEYGKIDIELLWETVTKDISQIREFSERQIAEYRREADESEGYEPEM